MNKPTLSADLVPLIATSAVVGSLAFFGPLNNPALEHTKSITQELELYRSRPTASVSSVSSIQDIADLSHRFGFQDYASSLRFLVENPKVYGRLFEAVPTINKIFGNSSKVTLYLVSDQESSQSLAIRVQVIGTVEHARALRKEFYKTFWMPRASKVSLPVSFNVEAV